MLLERKYGWAIGSYEFWEAGNYYLRISHPDVAAGGNVSISRVLDLDLLKERNPERWQDRVAFMAPLLVLDYSYCQLLEDESASVGGLLYRQQSNPLEFYAPFGEWAARLSRILQLLP